MSESPEIFCPTFDDGPDPLWTPRFLDVLGEFGVEATFFVVSPLAVLHRGIVSRMVSEGHEVAFHCDRHVRHTHMTDEEVLLDTRRGLEGLASIGVEPEFWRPPWGIVTSGTERAAREFGLRLELWSSDTHDWRGDTSGEMFRAVSPDIVPGAVILMHDGIGPGATRDGCGHTLSLVPKLIEEAESRGLRAGTVSRLRGVRGTSAGRAEASTTSA